MSKTLNMMLYTVLEGVRSRIFFIAIVFSAFLLVFSRALSALSFSEHERLLFDFGVAALNFCLILLTVYCGVVLYSQELQARSLMGLLSKPISRTQFVVGKYLGYLLVCFLVLLTLSFVLAGLFYTSDLPITLHLPMAVMGILCDVAIILALIFLFSTVTNSFLALCFTIAILLMGHSHQAVRYFAEMRGDLLMVGLDFFMKYFIPNFEVWNWKDRYYEVIAGTPHSFITSFSHAALWVIGILLLSTTIFRSRDCA
jgi:Cu-processing system permease protein